MTTSLVPSVRTRAVRFDHYGDRDVLEVRDVDLSALGSGEVLVRVRAAGINPGEAMIRSGLLHDILPATFPSGQGTDLAGVVVDIAPDVTDFAVGDEVLGFSWSRSSHAQHVVVPASQLLPKPHALSWEVAGALDVAGTTAYAAVRAIPVRPGDVVAVSAATGSVGTLVVQLLVQQSATVLGIASSTNAEWLISHGVTPVLYGDGLEDRLRAAAP
jgi:NADPH2:quinone reductase